MTDKYSVLYKVNLKLCINSDSRIVNYANSMDIPTSDIVSISVIHNYDKAMYPILRLRLYTDLSVIEILTADPDKISVLLNMDGAVYRMNEDEQKSPTPIAGAGSFRVSLKGYIENKNTATSLMDQYDKGIKKTDDLNVVRKVPIELYCFDDEAIHYMRRKAPAIFKDMSITTIIESMFMQQGHIKTDISPMQNQVKYDQVLIPNLSITEAISYFDARYGLYPKGGQVYGDFDKLIICDSDVNSGDLPVPIYVESYKNASNTGGLRKIGRLYQMNTKAENVSVISETEIEKVLNSESINAINIHDLSVETSDLLALFPDMQLLMRGAPTEALVYYIDKVREMIQTPDILHKTKNKYLAETFVARITERVTKVDVSGVGFDFTKININTRFNLIFDSPLRGMSINKRYRPKTAVHVITNLDSDLFIAQTSLSICSN